MGTHGCIQVPLPRLVVPAGPRPVAHACSDRTSYFNLSNMPLCQYIVILLNYLLKIHEEVVSGGALRQGDGGNDSQEDESEWGDATLLSSGYVVCNDWGSLEADRWESTSLGTDRIEIGEISICCDGGNNHRKNLPYSNMYHHICLRHNTGIYPQVTGTRHFGKRAYPDPPVFSPVGIIGGYPGKMHCLPR